MRKINSLQIATEKRSTAIYHAALFAAVLIWGSTYINIKILLHQISPNTLAFIRFFIASAFLTPVFFLKREKLIPFRDWPRVALGGLTGMALYNFFQNQALQYAGATEAAILTAMSPIFMAFIARAFLGERLTRRQIIGVIAAFTGSVIVSTNGQLLSLEADSMRIFGDFLMLLTALVWAVYSTSIKELLNRYSPLSVLTHCTWAGTLFLLPTILLEWPLDLSRITPWGWANIFYLGIFASAIAYLLWNTALPQVGVTSSAVYIYLIPVFSAVMAVFFLQEPITVYTLLGGAVVMTGTYFAGR